MLEETTSKGSITARTGFYIVIKSQMANLANASRPQVKTLPHFMWDCKYVILYEQCLWK